MPDPLSDFNRQSTLDDIIDAAVADLDYNGKVQYVHSLLEGVEADTAPAAGSTSEGQLLAIRRVVAQMTGRFPSLLKFG